MEKKEEIRTNEEHMKQVILSQQQYIEKLIATVKELSSFNHTLMCMVFQRVTIELPPRLFFDEDD